MIAGKFLLGARQGEVESVSGDALLRATGLTKTYGSLVALADASLSVRAGEVRSLVGANGAGKSTLIKILTGAVRPNAGQIAIDGKTIEPGDPARMLAHGVACIYQHSNLAPAMSVLDNIYPWPAADARMGLVGPPPPAPRSRGAPQAS